MNLAIVLVITHGLTFFFGLNVRHFNVRRHKRRPYRPSKARRR